MEELINLRKSLYENGYVLIPFSNESKFKMTQHIKSYLENVTQNRNDQMNNHDEIYTSHIMSMSDQEYIKNFSKPFRMFPENVSKCLVNWIQTEVSHFLGVDRADSNYVSQAERKLNSTLSETSYDMFWRCVRPNKDDVGPAHCDYQFWELMKNTDTDVGVPFNYNTRWKIWTPLMGCVKENMLQIIPKTHLENIPMQVIETKFGKRPWLDPEWYKTNKARFITPLTDDNGYCVLFHDKLIHRGPRNETRSLRISAEMTIITS